MSRFSFACRQTSTAVYFTFLGIIITFNLLITIILTFRLHHDKEQSQINKRVVVLATVSSFLWSITSICLVFTSIIEQSCSYDSNDGTVNSNNPLTFIVYPLFVFFYFFSLFSLYFLFATKLIYIVKNSVHQFSHRFEIFFYMLGYLQIVCYLATIVGFMNDNIYGFVMLSITGFVYISSSLFLSIKFIGKINAIIGYFENFVQSSSSSSGSCATDDIDININPVSNDKVVVRIERNEKARLIHVMVKSTVLLCVALFTSLIQVILFACHSVAVEYFGDTYLYRTIHTFILYAEITSNLICIYLQWPFAAKYYKCACKWCNYCAQIVLDK